MRRASHKINVIETSRTQRNEFGPSSGQSMKNLFIQLIIHEGTNAGESGRSGGGSFSELTLEEGQVVVLPRIGLQKSFLFKCMGVEHEDFHACSF